MIDHSRGDLPPAELLQLEPEPTERIGWKETLACGAFLIGLFAWAVLA